MNKILLVDDSNSVINLFKAKLAKKKYSVLVAKDMDSLKDILSGDESFICAVVDLNLPNVPRSYAVDFVAKKGIPVIVLSGEFSKTIREEIQSKFIVDYVYKGDIFSFDYVIYIIDRLPEIKGRKVLLVNDSKTQTFLIKSYLLELTFEVLTANDGEQALKLLQEHPDISFLFTDYVLPKMNGVQLITKIRKKFIAKDLVIIALTSNSSRDLSTQLLKAGADDFIAKPFTKGEFNKRIFKEIELHSILEENKQYLNIIDDYVLVSRTDANGVITYISKALKKVTQYDDEDFLGKDYNVLWHADNSKDDYKNLRQHLKKFGEWHGELKNRKKNGEPFWIELKILPLRNHDGKILEYIYILHDITVQKKIEEMSSVDYFTGLKNLHFFDKTLGEILAIPNLREDTISLVFIDMDNFKKINAIYGYENGDSVLKKISSIIVDEGDKYSLSARWYADKFMLLVHDSLEQSVKFSNYLMHKVRQADFSPVENVSCHIGVVSNRKQETARELLARVEYTLLKSKGQGEHFILR